MSVLILCQVERKAFPAFSFLISCAHLSGSTDARAQVWEMRQQKAVTGFEAGSGLPMTGFSFSENGYHVASVAADGVSLWDLRKMKCFK